MVLIKPVLLSQDLFGFSLFSKTRLWSPLLFGELVATLSGGTTIPSHLGQKQHTPHFYADLFTGVHKMNKACCPIRRLMFPSKDSPPAGERETGELTIVVHCGDC